MVPEFIVAGQHDDRGFKAVFAQDAHLTTVDIRQSHVHDYQVDLAIFGGLYAFYRFQRDSAESSCSANCSTNAFVTQSRHRRSGLFAYWPSSKNPKERRRAPRHSREVKHSGLKEQGN